MFMRLLLNWEMTSRFTGMHINRSIYKTVYVGLRDEVHPYMRTEDDKVLPKSSIMINRSVVF